MHQFDVLANPEPATAGWAPYLLVLQHDLLRELATVVVAPMVRADAFGRPAATLNPVFTIADARVVLSVAELAGVSRSGLGQRITSLADERDVILAALDLLFTGI